MKLLLGLVLVLTLIGLVGCQQDHAAPGKTAAVGAPRPDSTYVALAPGMQNFKSDFNAHVGDVRLVYIVSAVCPGCLHGMDVLGKALRFDRDNPRVRTYIVYVPALGAKAEDIAPTIGLVPGGYVRRFWDPRGTSGREFDHALGIGQFAWDVYMIYGPDQTWSGDVPPKPRFWMDQLGGLPAGRFLNAEIFAGKVRYTLAHAQSGATRDSTP